MINETKKLLFDIATACNEIESFIADKTQSDYIDTLLLRRGIERDLEIIGEAMNQLRVVDAATFNLVPNGHRIVGMRHRLIHAYGQINDYIVWDTVQSDIPELAQVVKKLLEEGD